MKSIARHFHLGDNYTVPFELDLLLHILSYQTELSFQIDPVGARIELRFHGSDLRYGM